MPTSFGPLITERLIGRRPVETDLADYVAIFTDERIPEEAWPKALRTEEDAGRILRDGIAHWKQHGFGPWTVLDRDTRDVVGRVGLSHAHVAGRPEIEVAWTFAGDVWGRGYATEVARETVRSAFVDLGLNHVVTYTTPENAPSKAVMRKVGFSFERDIQHAGLKHVLFRLRRVDWGGRLR